MSSFITKKGFMDIGDKASYRKAYQEFLEKLGKFDVKIDRCNYTPDRRK